MDVQVFLILENHEKAIQRLEKPYKSVKSLILIIIPDIILLYKFIKNLLKDEKN